MKKFIQETFWILNAVVMTMAGIFIIIKLMQLFSPPGIGSSGVDNGF